MEYFRDQSVKTKVFSRNSAKYTVHKAFQAVELPFYRKFHSLITYRTVRDPVHLQDLVYRHPEDGADHWFHFLYFCFRALVNHRIDGQKILYGSFHHSGNERTVLFFQILVLIQCFL